MRVRADQDRAARPRVSAGALAGVACGGVGILLALATSSQPRIAGLAILACLAALALGAWAEWSIVRNARRAGLGYARLGMAAALAGGLLLIASAGVQAAANDSGQVTCAKNLHRIVVAMVIYSQDNIDCFPLAGNPTKPGAYSAQTGIVGTKDSVDGALLEEPDRAAGNVTASLWMLVLRNQIQEKTLLCPDDPFIKAAGSGLEVGGKYQLTPADDHHLSYSINYPWRSAPDGPDDAGQVYVPLDPFRISVGGWWRNNTQSDLPIIADMAPLDGTRQPRRHVVQARIPANRAVWNSFNHHGQGQNIAYGDMHVEWARDAVNSRRPTSGPARSPVLDPRLGDNIWTAGHGTQEAAPKPGAIPPVAQPPRGRFDVIMVPLRDGNTGAIK